MRHTTLPLALLLLGVGRYAGAQAPPTAKAPAPLTLAQALAKLPPPTKGILLAVGADKVTLPDGTSPPPADASPTVLANTFGDITQEFGSVTAIAPATRVLLNDNPAVPDTLNGINAYTGFKVLAASLDDAQWKLLTSEGGLGLSDLNDDTQRLLFHSLFPDNVLWVASQDPAQTKLPDAQRTHRRNVSNQIDGVRVRIRQATHIYVHDKQGKTIFFSGPPADTTRLRAWRPPHSHSSAQNSVLLRAMVANTPKPSGLSLTDAKFQQAVTLTGIKTVGDLVGRIAAKTHTELYADPHYATRLLTIIGPTHEAPAVDVLAALALTVAGTYRQVGPAFVLTDDLEGVGTRRKRLQNWSDAAVNASSKLNNQAGAIMLKRHLSQARSLPTFGDPLALTPEQMAQLKDDAELPGIPSEDENYPYAKLTPAQQAQVQKIAASYEEQQATQIATSNDDAAPQEPNPTGAVSVRPHYAVQLLIPTVEGPVDGNTNVPLSMLYWPGNAVAEAYRSARKEQSAKDAPAVKLPPTPPLLPLLRSRSRRAVFGHPTTPAAVDALIAAMQKVGLNELWLDVFSGGKSRLTDKGTDILTEALTKTQGTGITVYADLSLLPWGNSPPEEARDLDILGQNSQQAAIADHDRKGNRSGSYDAVGKPIPYVPLPVFVSPVSEAVKKTLADTVRSLASRPGLAGFVWEDAESGEDLGYTLPRRLAFLRAFHADPVDITQSDYPSSDVSLPTFDDKVVDETLRDYWGSARLGANGFLLTLLRQAVPGKPNTPILMRRNDNSTDWLVSWDDPRQLPPPLRTLFAGNYSPSEAQVWAVAAKQGRTAFIVIPVQDPANTDALAFLLQVDLPAPSGRQKPAWNGYVLDFSDSHITDSTEPLRDLVRAATPKP